MSLAMTGRVPAGIRARVLAEHHAAAADRHHRMVVTNVRLGLHPVRVPFGYRILGDLTGRRCTSPPLLWDPDTPDRTDHGTNDSTYSGGYGGTYGGGYDSTYGGGYGGSGRGEVGGGGRAGLVEEIFRACLDGRTDTQIAAELAAGPPALQPIDLRTARVRPWTAARVAHILTDPHYLGVQVWGRTRHGRPVAPADWIYSRRPTHPPLIDRPTWDAVQELRRTRTRRSR